MQRLEVCFVSYASADHLDGAIRSVREHLGDATVAVQEHAASSTPVEHLAAEHRAAGTTVRVLHDPCNPGFGAGCNALAATSSATWLLLLNPDARITGWAVDLDTLDSACIYGPGTIVAPRPEAHRGRSYRVRDEIAWSWLRRTGPPPDGTGFVSGAALLISAAAMERTGGFDPRYFLFYEDIDLCLRANAMGIATRLLTGWSIDHPGGHSTAADPSAALSWSYESGCRFHAAHGHPVRGYQAYVATDATARAGRQLARRRHQWRRAYVTLARRAATDALTGRHP